MKWIFECNEHVIEPSKKSNFLSKSVKAKENAGVSILKLFLLHISKYIKIKI